MLHPGQHLAQVGLGGGADGVGGPEPAQRRAGDSARATSGSCVAKMKRTSACSCAGSLLLAGTGTIATCHSSASGHGFRSVSPVSSRASRSATASGSVSPGSPCPPTCSPRLLTLVPAQQHPAAFRVDDQRRGGDVQRAGPRLPRPRLLRQRPGARRRRPARGAVCGLPAGATARRGPRGHHRKRRRRTGRPARRPDWAGGGQRPRRRPRSTPSTSSWSTPSSATSQLAPDPAASAPPPARPAARQVPASTPTCSIFTQLGGPSRD